MACQDKKLFFHGVIAALLGLLLSENDLFEQVQW
jgi:hypothetical protein